MDDKGLEFLLKDLISLDKETEWVEFKTNNCSPDKLGECISALSNSACLHNKEHGYLVFGIENETHKILGTKFKPTQDKIGSQEIENWIATQLNPRVDFEILEFSYQSKPIAIFKIDASHDTPVRFKSFAYIRVGSYNKKLNDHPGKARKIWKKTGNMSFEDKIALRNISENQALQTLDHESYFNLMNSPLPSTKQGILNKMTEKGIIVRERDNNYSVTNLGAILFANKLEDFEHLARKAVRVIVYKGKDKLNAVHEQVGIKGYAAGFEGLYDYIIRLLPSKEALLKGRRSTIEVYPPIAMRELIVNALIHQDFSEAGTGVMIEIYEDRIEISNPGVPLIDIFRFIDHHPKSRNEKLASLMRLMNICEERGSGIDKVIFYCELYQLPAPDFIAGTDFLRATVYAPKTLREMDKRDKLRACYQHSALKYVKNEDMTNQSLRERFKINKSNYSIVSRIIKDTLSERLIKYADPKGSSKKYAKYIPFWA